MEGSVDGGSPSLLGKIVEEIIYSPLNIALATVCAVLIYKIFSGRQKDSSPPPPPELPPLKRRDMTLAELKKYDGNGPEGRICMAVNGKVFDVTKGKRFYGPGGPYSAFGGKDASRGLATFTVEARNEDEFDDLSDLSQMEMDGVREWEMQFMEKYHYVGRLLRPGEDPTEYSDEENVKKEDGSVKKDGESVKKDEGSVKKDEGSVKKDEGSVKKDEDNVKKDEGNVKKDDTSSTEQSKLH